MKDNNENLTKILTENPYAVESEYWDNLARVVCWQSCYGDGHNSNNAICNFVLFKKIITENQFDKCNYLNKAMLDFVKPDGLTHSRTSRFIECTKGFFNTIFNDEDIRNSFINMISSSILGSTEFANLIDSGDMVTDIAVIGNYHDDNNVSDFIWSNIICMRIEFSLRIVEWISEIKPGIYPSVSVEELDADIKPIDPWHNII